MTPEQEEMENQCEELFQTYIDHALAFCNKTKITWPDGTFTDPDESLMRQVENAIDVPEQSAFDFRMNVCVQVLGIERSGDNATWRDIDPLYNAIGRIVGGGGGTAPPPLPDVCTCDIMVLMAKGCTCGHMKNGKN